MKTLLTAIILVICIGAKAQQLQNTPYGIGYGIAMPETLETIRAIIPVKGDTAFVSDTSIHYIKIGEQVFEIKRSVTLEPSIPSLRIDGGRLVYPKGWFGNGSISGTVDTSIIRTNKLGYMFY